nr:ribonuclease H-like domain-containing protein [Tanacetum cinerariifolium]
DWQFLHHSSANSWQWDLHSSGSRNTLHWQWELILSVGTFSWQWECLVHFIPNNQRRNVKFSKNKMFVTASNDSLNAKTLNVNSVCATCETYVLNDKHDMCVFNSVAKPLKKTVASESKQKPRNITRKLYEHLVEIVLFIVDSWCSKHMMGNLKLLINFVEKFLGT